MPLPISPHVDVASATSVHNIVVALEVTHGEFRDSFSRASNIFGSVPAAPVGQGARPRSNLRQDF